MSGGEKRAPFQNYQTHDAESPKSRKRRERIERQTKEKEDLDKMMNYNPFGKDLRKIGSSVDRL